LDLPGNDTALSFTKSAGGIVSNEVTVFGHPIESRRVAVGGENNDAPLGDFRDPFFEAFAFAHRKKESPLSSKRSMTSSLWTSKP
jgi:hypothetical protein